MGSTDAVRTGTFAPQSSVATPVGLTGVVGSTGTGGTAIFASEPSVATAEMALKQM